MNFLRGKRLLFKNFGSYSKKQGEIIGEQIEKWAEKRGRPSLYLRSSRTRKDDLVREILEKQPTERGLVCVLRGVEACHSFRLVYGKGRPQLVNTTRKCLCYYVYLLDREFGLIHIRIQTWAPFTVQVCLNGHDWLARGMDDAGIGYTQKDNCFTHIDDPAHAQRLADRFVKLKWKSKLDRGLKGKMSQ